MTFEFSPQSAKSMPPLPRKRTPTSLAMTDEKSPASVSPKYGFGIDEFLEEFKFLSGLDSTLLNNASDYKIEKNRLYFLITWGEKLREVLLRERKTLQFEGRAFDALVLILYRLNYAFDEAIKKTNIEAKASKSNVYDFGLKKFLQQYATVISPKLKEYFEFIHQIYNNPSDENQMLGALVFWVRKAQKLFQFDRDALTLLEAIKFRLRVGLLINEVLESTSQKMALLSSKKNELNKKLKAVKALEPEKQTINNALSKIVEEMNHQPLSKSLIEMLKKLSESDVSIEMPIVVCETKAEKSLVDKIQKNIKRYNKRVESFSLRKPPEMNALTESETSETQVESEETSQESREEQAFFEAIARMRARRYSDARFGLESPSPLSLLKKDTESALSDVEEQEAEPVKVWCFNTQKVESELKKIMQNIEDKNKQLLRLRKINIEYARSVEELKTEMFRSMPEVVKSKTIKALKNIDQKYHEYKTAENKDAVLKQAVMTSWDRICEKLGVALSTRHAARKTEIQKYFQALDARAQLEAGLQIGNDGKIASSFNKLTVSEGYLNLWKRLCETKNKVSENTASGNKILAEIEEQQERLKQIQAEQKHQDDSELDVKSEQEQRVDAKTKEPLQTSGFMLEL